MMRDELGEIVPLQQREGVFDELNFLVAVF